MALIEWQNSFEIGIESVDFEHRQLINMINALYGMLSADAPAEEIGQFLGEVDARISAHFALEEKEMRDLQYDQLADHKADHERLLDQIGDIADAFERGAYTDYDDQLAAHLKTWFSEHFRTKDARLHRFLENRRS